MVLSDTGGEINTPIQDLDLFMEQLSQVQIKIIENSQMQDLIVEMYDAGYASVVEENPTASREVFNETLRNVYVQENPVAEDILREAYFVGGEECRIWLAQRGDLSTVEQDLKPDTQTSELTFLEKFELKAAKAFEATLPSIPDTDWISLERTFNEPIHKVLRAIIKIEQQRKSKTDPSDLH